MNSTSMGGRPVRSTELVPCFPGVSAFDLSLGLRVLPCGVRSGRVLDVWREKIFPARFKFSLSLISTPDNYFPFLLTIARKRSCGGKKMSMMDVAIQPSLSEFPAVGQILTGLRRESSQISSDPNQSGCAGIVTSSARTIMCLCRSGNCPGTRPSRAREMNYPFDTQRRQDGRLNRL